MNEALLFGTGLALGVIVGWLVCGLRRKPDLKEPLAEVKRELVESFNRANTDMAERVERIKGDLRTDLAERLQTGMTGVRDTVSSQLSEGRNEQSKTLASLGLSLQEKFDRLREAQTHTARETRGELAKSLGDNSAELQKKFDSLEAKTGQSLEQIRARVDERLQTIGDQVQQKLEKNIQEGFAHFQKVQDHLKAAEEQLRNVGTVGQSINELNNLLKMPHLRGKFGEAELSKLLADFLPAGAYEEQVSIVPDSKETVDAIVKFPKVKLPIDSKFNREQILPLFETNDPSQLKEARKQLAVVIKQQAQSINEKYVHPEHGTSDLALMFLPSETIYFEVIRNLELCEAMHKANVFPVSPNTLAITLKSIAMSFGFHEFAKNVEKTLEQIKQAQKSFGLFQKKFEDVGKGLNKAQEAYGTAIGHLNRYTNKVVRLTGESVPEVSDETVVPEAHAEGERGTELLLKPADSESETLA